MSRLATGLYVRQTVRSRFGTVACLRAIVPHFLIASNFDNCAGTAARLRAAVLKFLKLHLFVVHWRPPPCYQCHSVQFQGLQLLCRPPHPRCAPSVGIIHNSNASSEARNGFPRKSVYWFPALPSHSGLYNERDDARRSTCRCIAS